VTTEPEPSTTEAPCKPFLAENKLEADAEALAGTETAEGAIGTDELEAAACEAEAIFDEDAIVEAGTEATDPAGTDTEENEADAGATEADAGATEADAGATEADAGATEADAGATEADAGATEADAGATEADAGATEADAKAAESVEKTTDETDGDEGLFKIKVL